MIIDEDSVPALSQASRPASESTSRAGAIAVAALLGLVLVYGAGFVQVDAVHNAAHDARHAAGFPCH
jgi:cobalt transporter subunit CbtB